MRKSLLLIGLFVVSGFAYGVEPIDGLLERIDPGLSHKIVTEISPDTLDYFELSQRGDCPVVRGNNAVSVATGINWYLKYVAGIHLSWNGMTAAMPAVLPAVKEPLRKSTPATMRYYLNYCTHSYSMAFWNWERWQQEIDWMALHGINMPLAITGTDVLWRNVLRRLDYPEEKISAFVAGPAFQAWWLMNNLEGWGGPNTEEYYRRQEELQKRIVGRMRSYGMEPVFAGYSGMVPHDANETLGLDVANPGQWLGYERPAFLQPTDKDFQRIAGVYYDELRRLYGTTRYYSMDPFHEGGSTQGVDLRAAGRSIMQAMKVNNPDAVWVIQAWGANPQVAMIDSLAAGDLVILDLHAEAEPLWDIPERGFGYHDWIYCMLHNFGGNIGLYGRIPAICHDYPEAAQSRTLRGVGLTMEGIETNPVLYELMCELPWLDGDIDAAQWIQGYVGARYGISTPEVDRAWLLLLQSVYNCPRGNPQQGTAESLFCARPSDNPRQASAWANYSPYYDSRLVYEAAQLLVEASPKFAQNKNFAYDLVDVTRQALADKGRELAARFALASQILDKEAYAESACQFLRLIELQDTLLATMPDFRVGTWLERARSCSTDSAEQVRYEWNARVQITTWGDRIASDEGRLHDYAHREWQGLLKDFYYPRWQRWFQARLANWDSPELPVIDFYAEEEPWTKARNYYSPLPQGDPAAVARRVLAEAMAM